MARRAAPSLAVCRLLCVLHRRFVSGEQAWSAELFHWRRRGVFRGARHVFHLHVAIWPTSELADRRRGVCVIVRMACGADCPARRLADWRSCEFLHGVFLRDVGVGFWHESAMAAEGIVSGGGTVVDIFRCNDCAEQFPRHEAQWKVDHPDVCGVSCVHVGVVGGLYGSRIVFENMMTVNSGV